MKQVARFSAALTVTVLVGALTVTPLCGAIFQCGCNFTHGVGRCNIFQAGVAHCPWCTQGFWAFWGMFALMMAASAMLIGAGLAWIRPALWVGLAAGLAGYLVWASLFGLGYALSSGYPSFYGLSL